MGCPGGTRLRTLATAAVCLSVLLWAVPAQATFPGANGKISFGSGDGIHTVNPDGSGETVLPPASASRGAARWSPDGQRFASGLECTDGSCTSRLATWAADGTDEQVVPNVEGVMPAWSSDGGRLAYVDVQQTQLRAADVDGTNDQLLATPACDPVRVPDWSPDGRRIAVERRQCHPSETGARIDFFCFESEPQCGPLFGGTQTLEDDQVSWSPDGTRVAVTRISFGEPDVFAFQYPAGPDQRLTTDPATDRSPAWSPDGTKVAFVSNRDDASPEACTPGSCQHAVYVMDADGGNQTRVSSIKDFPMAGLDWQPVPSAVTAGYVRPRSASPARFSLVPAMRECTSPNRVHGPPLAFGSCSGPAYLGRAASIGGGPTGAPARSVGSLRVSAQVGTPGPPDDSDVKLAFSVTNVMEDFVGGEVIDYTGELRVQIGVRLTDREPGLIGSTTQNFALGYEVQCIPTASTTVGSDCAGSTTANAVLPGSVTDGSRAVWALEQVRVLDGGSDDDFDTHPNGTFATQGLWVP